MCRRAVTGARAGGAAAHVGLDPGPRYGVQDTGGRWRWDRAYPPETVERVRLIKWAQGLGFSLREIAALARIPRDHVRGRAARVRSEAGAKIREIDGAIAPHGRAGVKAFLENTLGVDPPFGKILR